MNIILYIYASFCFDVGSVNTVSLDGTIERLLHVRMDADKAARCPVYYIYIVYNYIDIYCYLLLFIAMYCYLLLFIDIYCYCCLLLLLCINIYCYLRITIYCYLLIFIAIYYYLSLFIAMCYRK